MFLLALFCTFRFSFLLLQPSPSTAHPCSGWERFLGDCCWNDWRLENTLLPSTSLQVLWAPSCSACCCCLLGEDRRDEQGVPSPWHSCTGALCSSQEPGMAALPQMEDGTLGLITVCCFAAPKKSLRAV